MSIKKLFYISQIIYKTKNKFMFALYINFLLKRDLKLALTCCITPDFLPAVLRVISRIHNTHTHRAI